GRGARARRRYQDQVAAPGAPGPRANCPACNQDQTRGEGSGGAPGHWNRRPRSPHPVASSGRASARGLYIMVSPILIYRTDRGFAGVRCPYVQCPLPLTGAGNVAIVYRDELGRRVTASHPCTWIRDCWNRVSALTTSTWVTRA